MAPKGRGTKRGAAKTATAAAAKKTKLDPGVAAVMSAVEQTPSLPEGARRLLLAIAPYTFGTAVEQRHEAQTKAAAMIGEAVAVREQLLQEQVRTTEERRDEATQSLAGLEASCKEAEEVLGAAVGAADAQRLALAEAEGAVTRARAVVAEKQVSHKPLEAELAKAQEELRSLQAAAEGPLRAIVEGPCDDETLAKEHYAALLPFIERLGLDESLLSALPSSCTTPLAARSDFGKMAVQELGNAFGRSVAKAAEAVEARAAVVREAHASVGSVAAELDAAVASANSAEEALDAARQRQEAAAIAAATAKRDCASQRAALEDLTERVTAAISALQEFQDTSLASFKLLQGRQLRQREEPKLPKAAEDGAGIAEGIAAAAAAVVPAAPVDVGGA